MLSRVKNALNISTSHPQFIASFDSHLAVFVILLNTDTRNVEILIVPTRVIRSCFEVKKALLASRRALIDCARWFQFSYEMTVLSLMLSIRADIYGNK